MYIVYNPFLQAFSVSTFGNQALSAYILSTLIRNFTIRLTFAYGKPNMIVNLVKKI